MLYVGSGFVEVKISDEALNRALPILLDLRRRLLLIMVDIIAKNAH